MEEGIIIKITVIVGTFVSTKNQARLRINADH